MSKFKNTKNMEAVYTPPPQNNEFKMITNYIVGFHGREVLRRVSTGKH